MPMQIPKLHFFEDPEEFEEEEFDFEEEEFDFEEEEIEEAQIKKWIKLQRALEEFDFDELFDVIYMILIYFLTRTRKSQQ